LRVHITIALLERVLSASAPCGSGGGHCVHHARTKQVTFASATSRSAAINA
jgi:hypothetical protein